VRDTGRRWSCDVVVVLLVAARVSGLPGPGLAFVGVADPGCSTTGLPSSDRRVGVDYP
jgi:hypothetical protein